jgi:hypothetical protein
MSQQMRRTLAAVGLVAALLLAVPAPSRAATFRGPVLAGSVVERLWAWLSSLVQTAPAGQSTPATRTGSSSTPPPASPPPSTNNESGSMIDPDGKP